MERYRISIIIPHYNAPEKLDRLLQSIGDHLDVQVVVVDDRSTNELIKYENIRQKFECERITFLRNETGTKGAGTCRNVGLKCARGEWLLFADSDDYFLPEWYNTVAAYFESGFDIVYFAPTSRKENGKESSRHVKYANMVLKDSPKAYLELRYDFTPPWSKLIRHALVTKHEIAFEEVRYSNDVLFSVKSGFYAKRIATDPHIIYCVTEDDNNTSLTKAKNDEAFYIRCRVECGRWTFLRDGLSKSELKMVFRGEAMKRFAVVLKRGYGIRALWRYFRLFRQYRYPILF